MFKTVYFDRISSYIHEDILTYFDFSMGSCYPFFCKLYKKKYTNFFKTQIFDSLCLSVLNLCTILSVGVVIICHTFFFLNHNIQNILVLVAYGGNMVNMCVSNVSNKELFK